MSDINVPEDPSSLDYYIHQKITQMREALKLGAGKEISFYELQEALIGFPHVYLTLITLQNSARLDHQKLKNEFDVWKDEKYIEIKHREHKKEVAGSKWASATELSAMVRAENKAEFLQKSNEVEEADHKYSFMNHLIDMWKSYQFVLGTLSSNIRSEVEMSRNKGI